MPASLVVGGSSGLGRFIVERFAERGNDVIITSRGPARAQDVAAEIGAATRGLTLDLAQVCGYDEQAGVCVQCELLA
jgi:NAD(P)-dependent dehydrogenase (short-subunit alcohol dehydrogenase family)